MRRIQPSQQQRLSPTLNTISERTESSLFPGRRVQTLSSAFKPATPIRLEVIIRSSAIVPASEMLVVSRTHSSALAPVSAIQRAEEMRSLVGERDCPTQPAITIHISVREQAKAEAGGIKTRFLVRPPER